MKVQKKLLSRYEKNSKSGNFMDGTSFLFLPYMSHHCLPALNSNSILANHSA